MLVKELSKNIIQVAIDIVIVYYIHQIETVKYVFQELIRRRIHSIDDSPFINPTLEGLIFPADESLMINHSRLYDFLTLEDAPSNSINIIVLHILLCVIVDVTGLVSYHLITFQMINK